MPKLVRMEAISSMIFGFLKRHMWRCYARQLLYPTRGRLGDEFEHAAYQTTLLAVAVMLGFVLTLLALFHGIWPNVLRSVFQNESVLIALFVLLGLGGYSLTWNYLLRNCRIEPSAAVEKFGCARDRVLVHVHFWLTLVVSFSLPFVIFTLTGNP